MKKLLKESRNSSRAAMLSIWQSKYRGSRLPGIVNSLVNDVISCWEAIANTDLSYLVLQRQGVDIKYGPFLTAWSISLSWHLCDLPAGKSINKLAELESGRIRTKAGAGKACHKRSVSYCKSEIPADAVKCCHCTSDLEEPFPSQIPAAKQRGINWNAVNSGYWPRGSRQVDAGVPVWLVARGIKCWLHGKEKEDSVWRKSNGYHRAWIWSGGREVGRKAGREAGVYFLDKNILNEISGKAASVWIDGKWWKALQSFPSLSSYDLMRIPWVKGFWHAGLT